MFAKQEFKSAEIHTNKEHFDLNNVKQNNTRVTQKKEFTEKSPESDLSGRKSREKFLQEENLTKTLAST